MLILILLRGLPSSTCSSYVYLSPGSIDIDIVTVYRSHRYYIRVCSSGSGSALVSGLWSRPPTTPAPTLTPLLYSPLFLTTLLYFIPARSYESGRRKNVNRRSSPMYM